jgi:hypothetical protein
MVFSYNKITSPLNKFNIKNPNIKSYKSTLLLNNSFSNNELLNLNKKKDKKSLLNDRLIEYDQMKYKSEAIEQKIKNVKELIKYNGGLTNNIYIGDKLNSLLIDSIKEKIKTLKLMKNI